MTIKCSFLRLKIYFIFFKFQYENGENDNCSRLGEKKKLSDLILVSLETPDVNEYDPTEASEIWYNGGVRTIRPLYKDELRVHFDILFYQKWSVERFHLIKCLYVIFPPLSIAVVLYEHKIKITTEILQLNTF